MYSMTSKFVHGSSLLKNAYREGCFGVPADNARQALLACIHSIQVLIEMTEFFGVPFRKEDQLLWSLQVLTANQRLDGTPAR